MALFPDRTFVTARADDPEAPPQPLLRATEVVVPEEIQAVFEVKIDGAWHDLTCFLRGVSLQRGTTSAIGPFEASVIDFSLNNPDAVLSPWAQATPWSTQIKRVFRANLPVRFSITSTSAEAEALFASNPVILELTTDPTIGQGKPGDLALVRGATTKLWGPKGPADALPPPVVLGDHLWDTAGGTGKIWMAGSTMKWSRYDRYGTDCLPGFLRYAKPGARLILQTTPPAGKGYLDAALGTITTPDPGTLPAEFTVVMQVTGPAQDDPAAVHTVVGQWEADGQRSWLLNRAEVDGDLNFDTSSTGAPTDATSRSTPAPLITTGADTIAISVRLNAAGLTNATLWRSVDEGATFTEVGTGEDLPTAAVFDANTVLRIGGHSGAAGDERFDGLIHFVELRTGLDPKAGTVQWRFDADDYPGTGTVFADPRGHTWTLSAAGCVTRHRAQTFQDDIDTITTDASTITVAFETFFPLPTFAVPGTTVRTTTQPAIPVDTNWANTAWPWNFTAAQLPIPRVEFSRSLPNLPNPAWPLKSVIVLPPILGAPGTAGTRYDALQVTTVSGRQQWVSVGFYIADPPLAVWNEDLAEGRWQLFTGTVDSWIDNDLADGDRFIEGSASDGFKFLAGHEFEQLAAPVGSGELGGARIARILDATTRQPFTGIEVPTQGWQAGVRLDPGDIKMAGIDFGRPALEEIQATALAEGGRCFVNRFGDFVFLDNARLTAAEQSPDWEVSDGQGTNSICASSIISSADDLDIVNQIGVGRSAADPQTAVWRRHEESITLHGQRTGRWLDLPHLLDTDSGMIADRLLAETAEVDYHITALVVNPLVENMGWAFSINVELMDLVKVTRVRSVQRLDDMARVVGISHNLTPEAYEVSLTLGPPTRIDLARGWDVSQWDNPPTDLWSST